jgi:hypothetical protein
MQQIYMHQLITELRCKQDINLDPYGESSINEGGIGNATGFLKYVLEQNSNSKCQKIMPRNGIYRSRYSTRAHKVVL